MAALLRDSRITLENAIPTANAGNRKTKPASGPAIPMSKSALRE